MSGQFTPGPWVTRANDCADSGPHERVGKYVPGAGAFQIIANCSHEATGGTDSEANARLIAAAPELLASLEAIDVFWSEDGATPEDPFWSDDMVATWKRIRAAIALATGGPA